MTPSTTITGKLLRKISHAAVTKPSFVNASARAVKIPEIRTALKPPRNLRALAFCSPLTGYSIKDPVCRQRSETHSGGVDAEYGKSSELEQDSL